MSDTSQKERSQQGKREASLSPPRTNTPPCRELKSLRLSRELNPITPGTVIESHKLSWKTKSRNIQNPLRLATVEASPRRQRKS